jgi:hypothetical protein
MKMWLRAALLVGIASVSGFAAGDELSLSLPEYKSRLEQFSAEFQKVVEHHEYAVDFYREVPSAIKVQTQAGEITVSFEFLRDGLGSYLKAAPAAKPVMLSQLAGRIQSMRTEADNFEHARAGDPMIRERLNQILSAHEFGKLRGPTELDLLEERIRDWLDRKLNKLFPTAPDLDQWGQIFVWISIAIVSCILAVWLYRRSRERLNEPTREVIPFFPSAKGWRAWLAESREQAHLGQWRDAIHLGFWAAVARLESDGMWPPDKARTPREYLNAIPSDSQSKPSFAAVSTTFEAAWYGGRPTSAGDFERFLAQLENLGCRA